jgi:Raf kinase inhibitor-like YbhB/YbcL family protein
MAFSLSSPAFSNGQAIPAKYTCDGENPSPPLQWSGAPNETRGFALIVEDPDAPSGMFRHWAVFDLPANVTALPEGIGGQGSGETLVQRVNDIGHANYDGPCPPSRPWHASLPLSVGGARHLVARGLARSQSLQHLARRRAAYAGPNRLGRHLCE